MTEREERYFRQAEALLEQLKTVLEFQRDELRAVLAIVSKHDTRAALAAVVEYLKDSGARLDRALGVTVH